MRELAQERDSFSQSIQEQRAATLLRLQNKYREQLHDQEHLANTKTMEM